MKKVFPKTPVFLLDQETARDTEKARAIRTAWRESKGGILVGTELALPYIRDGVDLCGIVSLDSLLALPEWRAHERVFSIVMTLASISRAVMVQTRRVDEPVLQLAKANHVDEFRERELLFRKQFSYPPYTTLITLTLIGSAARIEKESAALMKQFSPWNPVKHTTPAPRGQTRCVVLLKTSATDTANILSQLRATPPFVAVSWNPESTY